MNKGISFDYYKQHLYCVAGRKAVKSYPEGVYRCVQYGGVCAYKKCCNLHKNGGKVVDTGNGCGKLDEI